MSPANSDKASIESAVKALYRSDPDREWQRSERHRTEFAVTKRALVDHLPPPPARILDCGGGPGHYAIALSQQGYQVILYDLSPDLLSLAQTKSAQAGVTLSGIEQGTATDLSRFSDASFDGVLLMGPLYHLLAFEDRLQALREACRVAKPGAPVCAAFIGRYAGHRDAAAHYPLDAVQHPELYRVIGQTGLLPPRVDGKVGFVAYFTHPSEIEPLCKQAGLDVKVQLGVEGVVSMHEEKINALEGEAWQYWVDLNYEIAHDPAILGGVEHILAICVKPRWRHVLKTIATTLHHHHIPFKVVGGTSLALRGCAVPVNDVDLEMTVDHIYHFEELFKDDVVDSVQLRENENWRSHIGRFLIDGLNVEVMAGLFRRVGATWSPSFLATEDTVYLNDVPIPVVELEEEVLAYIRRGRLDRAAVALPHCDPERLAVLMRNAVHQELL